MHAPSPTDTLDTAILVKFCQNSLYLYNFFTTHILTHHCSYITGVTNNINNGSVSLGFPVSKASEPTCTEGPETCTHK